MIYFSNWLMDRLREKDWSQSDLARASGLTRQAISNYLASKITRPDEDALVKIAHALNIPSETIFRAAGLLQPALDKRDPRLGKIEYILPGLPERDRDEILAFVELKLRLAEQRGEYNPSINQ